MLVAQPRAGRRVTVRQIVSAPSIIPRTAYPKIFGNVGSQPRREPDSQHRAGEDEAPGTEPDSALARENNA